MHTTPPIAPPAPQLDIPPKVLLLEATTTTALPKLLPGLETALRANNVWTSRRQHTSTRAAELHLEVHRSAMPALYIVLTACGLHLDPPGRASLAALCSLQYPHPTSPTQLKLKLHQTHRTNPRSDT